jgi:hypothetical protein
MGATFQLSFAAGVFGRLEARIGGGARQVMIEYFPNSINHKTVLPCANGGNLGNNNCQWALG